MFHSHYIKRRKGKTRNLAGTLLRVLPFSPGKSISETPVLWSAFLKNFSVLVQYSGWASASSITQGGYSMPQLGPAYTSAQVLVSPLQGSLQPSCPHMVPIGYAKEQQDLYPWGFPEASSQVLVQGGGGAARQAEHSYWPALYFCKTPREWASKKALMCCSEVIQSIYVDNGPEGSMGSPFYYGQQSPDQTYFSLRDKLLKLSSFFHLLHKGENVKKWNSKLARSPR